MICALALACSPGVANAGATQRMDDPPLARRYAHPTPSTSPQEGCRDSQRYHCRRVRNGSLQSLPIIWLLWFQGWEKAPPIAHECARSWVRLNPRWRVVLLDEANLSEHVDRLLPSKRWSMLIRQYPAAASDLVRLHLCALWTPPHHAVIPATTKSTVCRGVAGWPNAVAYGRTRQTTASSRWTLGCGRRSARAASGYTLAAKVDGEIVATLHRGSWLHPIQVNTFRGLGSHLRSNTGVVTTETPAAPAHAATTGALFAALWTLPIIPRLLPPPLLRLALCMYRILGKCLWMAQTMFKPCLYISTGTSGWTTSSR